MAFLLAPSIVGYSTYQQVKKLDRPIEDYLGDLDKCNSDLLVSRTEVSSCKSYNLALLEKIETCSSQKSELEFNEKQNQLSLKNLESELQQTKNELLNLQSKYVSFSQNSANNICCKTQIDNPNIRFYEIVDNKVVCLEGGTKTINC
jgi:chromosome segregation ATPase